MKERKFSENIDKIYDTLSDEQKVEYKSKEDKMNKAFLIIGFVFVPIVLAVLIVGIIFCVKDNEYSLLIFALVFIAICAIIVQWIIRSSLNGLKANDEIKIKSYIERLEKQKEFKQREEEKQLQKNVNYRLSVDKIKAVTVLDAYTEVTDKLHAVLNYQEIIQTRVYKFKVDYIDGSSKIITANENSEEYNVLISRVTNNTANEEINSSNNFDKIREYKKLLDEGIITSEEFEAKKKELL